MVMGAAGNGWETVGPDPGLVPSCHISHYGLKKNIPQFSLPNYGQERFAVLGSAVSAL